MRWLFALPLVLTACQTGGETSDSDVQDVDRVAEAASLSAETFCDDVVSEAFIRDHFEIPVGVPVGTDHRRGTCAVYWDGESGYHPEASQAYLSFMVYDDAGAARAAFDQSRQTARGSDDYTVVPADDLGGGAVIERRHETRDGRALYGSAVWFTAGNAQIGVRQAFPNAMNEYDRWTPELAAGREDRLLALARALRQRI